MKVSESPYGMSESYAVKFMYKDTIFWNKGEEIFYANSKDAHRMIEKYAKDILTGWYGEVEILSVTYQ